MNNFKFLFNLLIVRIEFLRVKSNMENSKNDESTQNDTILVRKKKKKNPFDQFILDVKENFKEFSEKSEDFFIKVDKNFQNNLKKLKASWKRTMKNIKESTPKYKRYKRLYTKLSEIQEDTKEIKMNVSELASLIEPMMDQMMEQINNIEDYMKENLGSDWKVLKNAWQRCKEGEISKTKFIKTALSKIGKRFASIFIQV